MASAPDWHDIAWLREQTWLPILLKGVLAPQDAQQAIDIGAAGLVISNHGGRTLDTVPATIDGALTGCSTLADIGPNLLQRRM